MLEAVLNYLHNDFPVYGGAQSGEFEIASGVLGCDFLQSGQYYRICGSVFNDGVHRYPCDELDCMTDEVFSGTVIPLAIPPAVVKISEEIKKYREENPDTDKVSESFGGYSYTRAGATEGAQARGWVAVFGPRLRRWRKV